jgi:drug/metabolite transporter (DMT)-like permease
MWLTLSGLIGLVLGDSWGFKALVMIGPRLTTLLRATTPIMTTIIAWFMLGERLKPIDLIGIALTVGGVAWVITERQFIPQNGRELEAGHPDAGSLFKGVLLGLGAAAGQAIGLVMSKHAMLDFETTLDAMPSSFVRMVASMLMIWTFTGLRGRLPDTLRAFRNRPAMLFSLGGAITGPFLAVTLSLVAIKYVETGIAATLSSMAPILVIPLVVIIYKEKVSPRAIVGAIVAFLGVALLFVGDEISRFFQNF